MATRPFSKCVLTSDRCLVNWWYLDPRIYSPEKMQAIILNFSPPSRSTAEVSAAVRAFGSRCLAEGTTWIVVPLCAALALLGLRSRSTFLVLLTMLGGTGLMLLFLSVFLRLPTYVCQTLLTLPCWMALWLGDTGQASPRASWHGMRRTCGRVFVGVTVLVLLRSDTPLAVAHKASQVAVQNNGNLRTALHRLNPTPSQTFVAWGAAFPYEAILPLERYDYFHGLRLIAVASGNQAPFQNRMLATQGITDLPRSLFEREDVFLVLAPESGHDQLLITYIAEHYGVRIQIDPVFAQLPLRVWRVRRLEPGPVG